MRQPTIHQMREKKKSSRKSQERRKITTGIIKPIEGSSVASWLSEKVLRGRGPDASGFESHRRGRIFFKGRNLRRAMDVCVCLLGADGRAVEGRINTLSATTARSARVRVPSGKGAHGCINVVVYVCECEVEWA
jgi:hypothetical protein